MYPTLFLAHGLPTLVTEEHAYVRFLKNLGTRLPRPKGVVLFSAHWESATQFVTGAQRLETMKDFFGYADELYRFDYPAKGDIALTHKLQRLLTAEGVRCETDAERGLDHAAWSILSLMFPEADVPVVAASVNPRLVPEEHYRIGQAISGLRDEGYLIIASGGTVHNLQKLEWHSLKKTDWAVAFDAWLREHIQVWYLEALFEYDRRAPYAREAVPTREHLAPLFISMGASDRRRRAALLHQEYQLGSLSLCGWMFG